MKQFTYLKGRLKLFDQFIVSVAIFMISCAMMGAEAMDDLDHPLGK
jgi:hypothetical protein